MYVEIHKNFLHPHLKTRERDEEKKKVYKLMSLKRILFLLYLIRCGGCEDEMNWDKEEMLKKVTLKHAHKNIILKSRQEKRKFEKFSYRN